MKYLLEDDGEGWGWEIVQGKRGRHSYKKVRYSQSETYPPSQKQMRLVLRF